MGEILGREIPGAEAVNLDAWEAELARRLDGLGADTAAPARLARYHRLLCEWNARMNLTGDTDFAVALYRHYLDSLAPLRLEGLFAHGARVIDVGSGAGFPGLPLAIARPDLRVTLLDALQKRISFLSAVVEELGLTHVRLLHVRAEDGARNPEHRERYDLAVARAVATLPVLCELMLPFVAVFLGAPHICCRTVHLLLRQESGGPGRNDIDMGAPVRPRMSRGRACAASGRVRSVEQRRPLHASGGQSGTMGTHR